jgi:nucleotide-binding universal stress UspA family protein
MAQMVPRTSYDHIVLLTDLTSRSNSALSYARAFAQCFSSRLTLLHTLPKRSKFDLLGSRAENRLDMKKARAELETIADGLKALDINAHIDLCEAAEPSDGILGRLDHLDPDLVIQGTAGIDDPRRALVGSVAESIFRRCTIPILTVGAQVMPFMEKGLHFDRILFFTNFGSQSNIAAIYALSLAEEFRARVTFCHVYDGRTASWNKDDIKEYFERTLAHHIPPEVKDWCQPECLVLFGDVDAEIRRFTKQQSPDLVITAAHALGPMGTRGKPGIAFKIIASVECPVLTILGRAVKTEHPVYPDNCSEIQVIG